MKVTPGRAYGDGDRIVLSEQPNVPVYPLEPCGAHPSPLPPVTPIPGLDIRSADDLLSPESRRELSEWLRREAKRQRLARASAAWMPLP